MKRTTNAAKALSALREEPPKTPKGQKGRIGKFFKDNYTGWLFNAPLAIGLLIFTLIPVGYSLYISFWRTNGINIWEWRGLDNYIRMFTIDREEMGIVLFNTFYYVIVSVPLSLVVSYLMAVLVNTTIVKHVNTFRIVYYLPCMIPAVAAALLWTDMMKYRQRRKHGHPQPDPPCTGHARFPLVPKRRPRRHRLPVFYQSVEYGQRHDPVAFRLQEHR